MKYKWIFLPVLLLLVGLFWANRISPKTEAVLLVEKYLQGLANHDGNLVSNLSCKTWETEALMEVDSFQLVQVTLNDVKCEAVSEQPNEIDQPNEIMVKCSGAIETSYNNEETRIDLSQHNYRVSRENGDLFVCGYQ